MLSVEGWAELRFGPAALSARASVVDGEDLLEVSSAGERTYTNPAGT